MKTSLAYLLIVFAPVLAGCSFSRSVVNPGHDRHHTSWIVPGKTTKAEVIMHLGMPPSVINGRGGVKPDSMRWVTSDTFTGTLEAGYIITPTFQMSREYHRHDLLIRFDEHGVVSHLSRTRSVNGENRVIEFREAP